MATIEETDAIFCLVSILSHSRQPNREPCVSDKTQNLLETD